jgi:hexosaminidase
MDIHTRLDHPELAIIPWPAKVKCDEGYFQLTRDTVIVTDNQTQAVGTLLADLLAPALGFSPLVLTGTPSDLPAISLGFDPALTHLGKEGYTLQVTPHQLVLRGTNPAGVFYGIQTLRQLLPVEIFSSTPISRSWSVPAITIEDSPRLQWRGLMLDVARHFTPKQSLFKLIDLLALHKMNMLHLHLTDDQGWRIEIKKYPKLTEVGSHRRETLIGHALAPKGYDSIPYEGFYTQDDLREIVAYASARFITVVPEIEMPGHAQAAIASYPELGVFGKPIEVSTKWGIHSYLYNPTDKTIQFLKDVLIEVMALFPGPYIHIGGDEVWKEQWQTSQEVGARIKELGLHDEEELQTWFLTQMGTVLTQHGRRLVGWDEILDGGLPPEAVVMSWRGINGGIIAARAGHDVIMTPHTYVYLDYYQSHDPAEPLAIGRYTLLDKVYAFDPVPAVLTAEQARHILGAQCMLWTEYISSMDHLEYMMFPRAIALAEVTWTPKERRDFADFRRRLATHEARLMNLKVNFRLVAKLDQEYLFPARKDIMASFGPIEPTLEMPEGMNRLSKERGV